MAHAEIAVPAYPLSPPAADARVRWPKAVVALVLTVAAFALALPLGGEPGRFATIGLSYAPVIVLAAVLQLSRWKVARVVSWIIFWLTMLGVGVVGLGLSLVSTVPFGSAPSLDQSMRLAGMSLVMLLIVLAGAVVTATGAWAALGRRFGAQIETSSPAHAQGVVGLLVMSALAVVPLLLMGGRAPLLDLLGALPESAVGVGGGGAVQDLLTEVYSVAWTVVLVLFGAAWPGRASWRAALARLGLGRFPRRDALTVLGVTVGAAVLSAGLDWLSHTLLAALGLPITDASVVTRMFPVAATPLGALVVAACAGFSEELIFRGLLQPRVGWFLANLGFTAMHAFQYGLDGLAVVFLIGVLLAYARQRWNTTASITVHVGYDALLLLASAFFS